jgi:hypothetical protein
MSLCEGGGSGANPGGKAIFRKVPKRNSRLATPSRWRQPGQHRSGPPSFSVHSSEALTVMQRSFKPLKQGRYLPWEPSFLSHDVGHGVSVSISPCEGDGTGANPVGQPKFFPMTPWLSSEAGGCNPSHAGAIPAGVSTFRRGPSPRAIRPTARTPRFQRGNPGAAPGWRSRWLLGSGGASPHRSSKPATLNRGMDVARFDASAPRQIAFLCFRSSMEQSAGLRTRRLRVRVPPKVPAPLSFSSRRHLLGAASDFQCPRGPTSRGAGFRNRRLRVRIPPWVPFSIPSLIPESHNQQCTGL